MAKTPFQTPFDIPFEVPDAAGQGVTSRGGTTFGDEGMQKETPNMSGLPTLPVTFTPHNAPSQWDQVPEPALAPMGTIPTKGSTGSD